MIWQVKANRLTSDFVFPEYFENAQQAAGTKYDFMGNSN
jgi:hypothetical protein